MIEMIKFSTGEEWLKAREGRIGGSDASCILGMNPWKTNVELWREKTGIAIHDILDDNPLVQYGKNAEQYLRELFRLDYPECQVFYEPDNMWINSDYPWAHASLDGWMTDERGRKGILEIKTATISSTAQKAKWREGIPNNYYTQILHYFMVTGFEFAILKAQLKYEIPDDELYIQTKHYRIERKAVEDEIEYLIENEREFAECIRTKRTPALILPEI